MFANLNLRAIFRILVLIVLLGGIAETGFLAVSLFAMGGLPFKDDFSGGLSAWNSFMRQTCCAHSAEIMEAPLIPGKKAASFEVRFSDESMKGSKRSEFRLAATLFGADYEYRFKIFVPSDWE